MKTIIALPDHNYYLWQILVQINNFRKFGLEEDLIYVIGTFGDRKSDILKKILNSKEHKCQFFTYNDNRKSQKYACSLPANILKRFYRDNPSIRKEAVFYTDPDVIFTRNLNFSEFLNDNIWYLSDTKSYLDSRYIKSKGEELFKEMCQIVGVTPEEIENIDDNAGGAQHIIKNVDEIFWEKVENDSERLYIHMDKTSKKYSPEHPIQKWTASMWGLLWNAVYFKHEVKIDKKLNFCWATDPINKWDTCDIFHNAGATSDRKDLFLKTKYQTSPFNEELNFEKKFCSYNYVEEIKETKNNLKDLIF